MTQLAELRSELRSLGARRRRTHVGDVLRGGAAALVAAIGAYYLADRLWNLNVAARAFVDGLIVVGLGWFVVRKLFPALVQREDEIDSALRFERRRGIDSDLVAALQFDAELRTARGPQTYGSSQLAEAVIGQTARSSAGWNLRDEPLDGAPRSRRFALYAALAIGVITLAVQPRHAAVFAERVLLASPHYPSQTHIDRLTINGESILTTQTPFGPAGYARPTVPLGRPIQIELQVSGVLPQVATIELTGESGDRAEIELAVVAGRNDLFRGTLPAAVESARALLTAGDDYREFGLYASPLPALTVTLEVTPPPYAADLALEQPAPGRLYASVLEGSDVAVRVDGANKPLQRVELTCGESLHQLTPLDDARQTWRLDPSGTEFAGVAQPLEFSLDVVDRDGFSLVEPLRGNLALRADQPPSVTADVVTKFVLPTGKPTVIYQASDDLGVQSLAVERQVLRLDGTTATDLVAIPIAPEASRTAFAGRFPLELSSLQLHKGDKVTVRLQARDRRGDEAARATAQSEPLVLEVTDEPGLYQAMAETDQRSALKMDEIIQKQLLMTGKAGTGGTTPAPRPTGSGTPTATPTSATPIPPAPTGTGVKP